MKPSRTAFGIWSGGLFMKFGKALDEDEMCRLIRRSYEMGIRTFMTADVYGKGKADEMIGTALCDFPREDYSLVGAIGHDYYHGSREGSKGFPRFTDRRLRAENQYEEYLKMATEKAIRRCQAERFDLLLLHNPDRIGYSNDAVWRAMQSLKKEGLTDSIGIAPGPANGFTLDLISCFERFGECIDWAMMILNPLEPWPGTIPFPAAEKFDISIITRVVDYGGLFHGDVLPNHSFGIGDHRSFRPSGWVEDGNAKLNLMRPFAEKYGLTLLQLACLWNLSHSPVKSVVPTLIQEIGRGKLIEEKAAELADLPELKLDEKDVKSIMKIGNNKGCMKLKGGSPSHFGEAIADAWELDDELYDVAKRWKIQPETDLICLH